MGLGSFSKEIVYKLINEMLKFGAHLKFLICFIRQTRGWVWESLPRKFIQIDI